MNRFETYQNIFEDGGGQLHWRHELIGENGELLASTDPAAAVGTVQFWGASLSPLETSGLNIAQRQATVTLVSPDKSLVPNKRGSLVHPDSNNRLRSYAGIDIGADEPFMWQQSTLLFDEVTSVVEGGLVTVQASLIDQVQPLRTDFTSTFGFADDEPVEQVVERIMLQVYSADQFRITPTGYTVPAGSADPNDERFALVDSLLAGCGHELAVTSAGVVYNRPIPPTVRTDGSRWRYGDVGIPVQRAARVHVQNEQRGWTVEAGNLQTSEPDIVVTVYDRDPQSQGYFQSGGAARLGESRLPYVRSNNQGRVAGYGQLRRNGSGPALVEFTTIPNPAMLEGDQLELTIPEIFAVGDFRVIEVVLPQQNDGLMTVVARAAWDPEFEFDQPAIDPPPQTNCIVEFTDDFTRPNENLEILPGKTDGSPEWTEIGWSWQVIGNQAIQWYPDTWSLAFVNIPLCSSNHYSEVQIGGIPSGRFLGPAVRADGDFSCYVAVANDDGLITLEMWRNAELEERLGAFDVGEVPNGRSLRLTASGPQLVVELDGTTIISEVDDRRTGGHVGMLAYGGSGSNAPAVDSFQSGPVT